MLNIIVYLICFIISLFLGSLLLRYVYGKEGKWKSLLTANKNSDRTNVFCKINVILSYMIWPFVGSISYHFLSSYSFKEFVLYGLVTVFCSVAISFYFTFKNPKYYSTCHDNRGILILLILTQSIPFSILFILFSLVLSKFHSPFQ